MHVSLHFSMFMTDGFFFQEEKKKFDKQTDKYCLAVQNYLNLSAKKKEAFLQEVRR